MSRSFRIKTILLVPFLAFGACASEDSVPTSETITPQTSSWREVASKQLDLTISAGDSAARLGVYKWEFTADYISGVGKSGEIIAEFEGDMDLKVVRSILPEPGFQTLGKSSMSDTMPASSVSYLRALQEDLSRGVTEPDSTPKSASILACFATVEACASYRYYLVYNLGWVFPFGSDCQYGWAACAPGAALLVGGG